MRVCVRIAQALGMLVVPALAFAQASITGTVWDSSGAVVQPAGAHRRLNRMRHPPRLSASA